MAFLSAIASQSVASSTTFGTLDNFDVYNQTGHDVYGFEIEFEGLHASDVPYTYWSSGYGEGVVYEEAGSIVRVRYTNTNPNATANYFTSAITPSSVFATDGHTCTGGVNGCEHFGASLNANPTATRYYWLGNDPLNSNNLTRAEQVYLPGAPTFQVVNQNEVLANQQAIQDAIANNQPAPAPVAPIVQSHLEVPEVLPGQAFWIKEFKTTIEVGDYESDDGQNAVSLDDLMSGNDKVPQSETEVEWRLLWANGGLDDDGAGTEISDGSDQIVRRYEFYTYAGQFEDDQLEPKPICETCYDYGNGIFGPDPSNVGALIGTQMIAYNLDPNLNAFLQQQAVSQVPVPPAFFLFGSGLVSIIGLRMRRKH